MIIDRRKLHNYQTFGMKVISWQFDWFRLMRGFQVLHCLGDSHLDMFRQVSRQGYFHRTIFRFTEVGGATAMGMVNPNSRTDALNIYRRHLRFMSHSNHFLFVLGEVDCGFVIWYRAAKYHTSVEDQFERSLYNYQTFISSLIDQGYEKIIICSAPLPTIFDNQSWGEVANARREVAATLRQRTDLTRRYNARLRRFCMYRRLRFLDFEADLWDEQTQLINPHFLNKNALDHHLEPSAIAPVLARKLQEFDFR